MNNRSLSFDRMMGCFGCFGFDQKPRSVKDKRGIRNFFSQKLLPSGETEDDDDVSYSGEFNTSEDDSEGQPQANRSEDILNLRAENDMICRRFPVKETNRLVRSEDENGNRMINEYVREYRIGSGSYGKVVLYRSCVDGKHYAIKAFHKSQLLRLRVGQFETAMTDVLREVLIMKMLEHPNIVNLVEVIDDPESDDFFMVLEYVEGKWICEGSGRGCTLCEETVRKYLRDIVSGLTYLHAHNIVHGDIKPDNLLVTRHGTVKIGDFSVSQAFEDDNDELRRTPGTPVFTAPECCLGYGFPSSSMLDTLLYRIHKSTNYHCNVLLILLYIGLTYHGKASDTWALGVTLYCMTLGEYPFLGDTLQDTYEKIVNNPIVLPDDINPHLKNLIEGLLCKDPKARMTLGDVAEHSWVIGDDGPITEFLCLCKRKSLLKQQEEEDQYNACLIHTE